MRFRNTILALCLSGMAGTASAYDLLDAWRAAREHDAGFAAARAERDAGQEKAVQGRARLLPQIGLSGSITRNNPIEPDMASYTSRGYGVELSQPVFDVGKFAGIFALTQVPLAISEGLLTVLIFNALRRFNAQELQMLQVEKL